jgi:hypothetical protein
MSASWTFTKPPLPHVRGLVYGQGGEEKRNLMRKRGFEEVRDNRARILAAAPKSFRPFIVCLYETGCRPAERASATAADVKVIKGKTCIIFYPNDVRVSGYRHKNSSKGKTRMIHLTGESLAVRAWRWLRRHR